MARAIDLRSDTVTTPTQGMLDAMARARVGDDVLGDDPTVIELQERCAELFGKEAALFVPSGTMANLCALRAQTEPGDEVIAHEDSHIIAYEGGSYAAVGGCTVARAQGDRGQFEQSEIERLVRDDDHHYPCSRLVWMENTANLGGGSVWPIDRVASVGRAARAHDLRLHIDGARIWNACAELGCSPAEYARHVDTVSACFSKGLGCPVGSIVVGDRRTIHRAHRIRKMLGGAMRQSGLLAGAALYALNHHRDRLHEDHARARRLGAGLASIDGLIVDGGGQTNMVYFRVDPGLASASALCSSLESEGLRLLAEGTQLVRAVTHLHITDEDIEQAIQIVAHVVEAARAHSTPR